MQFALFFAVFHQLLADLKVQQRFAAKEIHFDMFTVFGRFNQKVQCFFAGFQTHQGALAVISATVAKQ